MFTSKLCLHVKNGLHVKMFVWKEYFTCNMCFFAALACQKETQFAPFRRHSQFVAEFGRFLFHDSCESNVAHLVRVSC